MRAAGKEFTNQVEKGLNKTNRVLGTYGRSLVKDVYQSRRELCSQYCPRC